MNMPEDAWLIGVGLVTIIWGHWLMPRQLGKVRERATPRGRERYDSFMERTFVNRLFKLPAIVGGVAVLIGVVYVLVEL